MFDKPALCLYNNTEIKSKEKNIKKLGKYSFSVLAVVLTFIIGAYYTLGVFLFNKNLVTPNVRTVSLATEKMDYQAVLNEFEDSELLQDGTLTTFTGYQTLNAEMFEEIDNVSVEEVEQLSGCKVGYTFTYDNESNVVTLYAQMQNEYGEIEIDTISGVGFINDSGEIDAVMNIEGEGILLSEMRSAGVIQNCGWFSRLVKKVAKAVAVVAAVVATAAVVVATAGAVAPAIVAVGVGVAGSTAVTAGSLAVGAAAGALFYSTIGKSAIKAGTAIGEVIGEGVEVIIEKKTKKIMAFCFDNIEYLMQKITVSGLSKYQEVGKIYLAAISGDGATYLSSIEITRTVAVWFMRLSKITNYVSYIGTGIYTFTSSLAYTIAKDASDNGLPIDGKAHGKSTDTKLYFRHWHDDHHLGHAFWGNPV